MKQHPQLNILLSLSDKSGITDFTHQLSSKFNLNLTATQGTAAYLQDYQISSQTVNQITKFPVILSGRVKSLHPAIHGAILANQKNPQHMSELKQFHIKPFDIVVVNFYPFKQTIKQNPSLDQAIESIDIGGPAMLRAAAKNFKSVIPVCDPRDYPSIATQLIKNQDLNFKQRLHLAQKAFQKTQKYDQAINTYLSSIKEAWKY